MSDFPFSKRTDWSLQNNPLSLALEKLHNQGTHILDLTESNPTRCGFVYPRLWLEAFTNQNNLTYTPEAKGIGLARRAIADYYQRKRITISSDKIILTSSTSEGYSFLLKLLTNPGDHVLVPKPSYPLFQFLLELHDVESDYYPLVYNGAWSIDRQAFRSLMTVQTKAVILVNPNNPTGSYVNADDMAFLNEQCLKNHMAIISDEVFFDYQLNTHINPYSLCLNNEVLTFVLSGISKILGLPQMKLSWIAVNGPNTIVDTAMQRLEIIADTYLSVNAPVQNALASWLMEESLVQKQILDKVNQNISTLHQHNLKPLAVDGGWYAVIHKPFIKSEESFVLSLLEQEQVLVHPGFFLILIKKDTWF